MRETRVPSLGREDPPQEDMVTHSGILASELWPCPSFMRNLVDYIDEGSQSGIGDEEQKSKDLVFFFLFSSVQLLHYVWFFVTPWTAARQASLSITPGACSNSCPSSQWCHPTISSSVVPFSCLQSFPASGSFPMSQFFTSRGQSIGVSASASVLPKNIQD